MSNFLFAPFLTFDNNLWQYLSDELRLKHDALLITSALLNICSSDLKYLRLEMSLVTHIKKIATVDKHWGRGSEQVKTAINKIQPEFIYSGTMMKQYIKIRRGDNIAYC